MTRHDPLHPGTSRAGLPPLRPATHHSLLAALFIVLGALLVGFLALLLAVLAIRQSSAAPAGATAGINGLEATWGWLLTAALLWGVLNLSWSLRAIRRRRAHGFYHHFAITIGCGLIAIGIQSLVFARSLTTEPLKPVAAVRSQPQHSAAGSAAAVAGNAEAGGKLFAASCVACHGPQAQGIANLAPALSSSEFIQSVDDTAVAAVIRNGRAPTDTDNKTGRPMPPGGGNPFLADEQVAHLVAFLRSLQGGAGEMAAGGGPTAVRLAGAVAPKAGGTGRGDARSATMVRRLTLALTGVHGLFVFAVMLLSTHLMLRRLVSGRQPHHPLLRRLTAGGWVIAAAAWLPVAWLCFG